MTEHQRVLAGIEGDRLARLFDALPAFVAVLRGTDHVFEYVNDDYLRLVGGDRRVLGQPVLEALPEIRDQGFVELLDAVYATGEPFHGDELPLMLDRRGDGVLEEVHVNFVYLPTTNAEGEIDGVLAHGVEVSEQVRSRRTVEELARELEVQRASLATVIERMPVGVVLCDANGNITSGNTIWRDFYGVPIDGLDDVGTWTVFEGVRPDGSVYAPDEYPLARSILRGEVVLGEPIEFRSAQTGEVRSTEVSSAPIRGEQDDIVSGVAVFVDVTERIALQHELAGRRATQDAQTRVEQVLDVAGDGIWVLDEQGRTVLMNPAAQRMTGFEPEDVIGKVSHWLLHHSHADGSEYPIEECPIYRSVFHAESCEVDDEVFWRKDGSSFPVAYRSTPIHQEGRLIGAVQVFRDLTEQRRADAERRRIREARLARHKAFEINDTVVQRLAVADMALGMGRHEEAAAAVKDALAVSKRIINDWANEGDADLTRSTPAGSDGGAP
ncbi:MAG: hypothetical protein JWM98_689 [Thermoleophilia bacterium]|nr:hypothetical protein [Thermoleophilia bacterium]